MYKIAIEMVAAFIRKKPYIYGVGVLSRVQTRKHHLGDWAIALDLIFKFLSDWQYDSPFINI